MSAAIARILLRYGSGALVVHGYLSADDANVLAMDPDMQMLIGTAIGALTEVWYVVARKMGWAT